MNKRMIRLAIAGSLAAMMCGVAGCGGNSPALTPTGTVVNLSIFDSTFTGKSGSVALNYPSLKGTDPQGNPLSGSLSIVPAAAVTVLQDGTQCYLNNAQGHLEPLRILFYNSRDAKLRASRTDSQESPKW